jgi:protoporphyrinogen IX oxidase
MLWIKAFHIVFVASWFAGLFYLPRLLVNLAQVSPSSKAEFQRLLGMAQRLNKFAWLLAVPALVLGTILWLWFGIGLHGPGNGWLHAKLTVVLLALLYQGVCGHYLRQFEKGISTKSHVFFRYFNEVSVLLFALAVVLVVVKPF